MPLFTLLLTDLILILVIRFFESWCVPAYTVLGIVNIAAYLFFTVCFFLQQRRKENSKGAAIQFVCIQMFLLAALFLFQLSAMFIEKHCN